MAGFARTMAPRRTECMRMLKANDQENPNGRSPGTSPSAPKLFIFLAALLAVVPVARAQESRGDMANLIQNVRDCEKLYRNIEVSYKISYRVGPNGPPQSAKASSTTLQSQQGYRCVLQGNKYFLKTERRASTSDGKSGTRTRVKGYDGELTRVLVDGTVANVYQGKKANADEFYPHTWLLSRALLRFPLSTWLAGGEELQRHPLAGGVYGQAVQKSFFEGEEVADGVRCLKLRCETYGPGRQKPSTVRYLWLTPERNYLPVKTVGFGPSYTDDFPLEVGRVEDFREIGSGIWLPFRYTLTVYDEQLAREKHQQVISNIEEGEMESAKLDPNYPVDFFRGVEIPEGAVVYELKDDKIINSYLKGERPGVFEAGVRSLWYWLFGGVLALLVLVVLRWAWRRRQRLRVAGEKRA